MAKNYDAIDFAWSWNGDILPGTDGDIADTSKDQIQSKIQEIQTVAASSVNDWEEYRTLGATLSDFVGEPNTRETADAIRERIRDALILFDVVKSEDLAIRVVPISRDAVMAIIRVNALPTENNSLADAKITVSLIFDYRERGIFFLEPTVGE